MVCRVTVSRCRNWNTCKVGALLSRIYVMDTICLSGLYVWMLTEVYLIWMLCMPYRISISQDQSFSRFLRKLKTNYFCYPQAIFWVHFLMKDLIRRTHADQCIFHCIWLDEYANIFEARRHIVSRFQNALDLGTEKHDQLLRKNILLSRSNYWSLKWCLEIIVQSVGYVMKTTSMRTLGRFCQKSVSWCFEIISHFWEVNNGPWSNNAPLRFLFSRHALSSIHFSYV